MRKDNKGFSLVELVIVLAILAILIGIIAPSYLAYANKTKRSIDVSNAEHIVDSLRLLYTSDDTITLSTFTWNKSTPIEGKGIYTTMFKDFGGVPVSKLDENLYWKVTCSTDAQGYATIESVYLLDSPTATVGYELYPDMSQYYDKCEKVTVY